MGLESHKLKFIDNWVVLKDTGCLICMLFWKFYCSRNPPCRESDGLVKFCVEILPHDALRQLMECLQLHFFYIMQLSKTTWKSSDCIGMCYMKNTTMRSVQQLQTKWIRKPNITFQSVINLNNYAMPHELFPTIMAFFCCCLFLAMATVECCQFA